LTDSEREQGTDQATFVEDPASAQVTFVKLV
jgi:hypothetical protein